MKLAVVPYHRYQLSELPIQLQERLMSRQRNDPDYAYQFVIGLEKPVWQNFLLGTVLVPASIYGLCWACHSIGGVILWFLLLVLICRLAVPICRCCFWVAERWRKLFPRRKLFPQKDRLRDRIYITTHYIIVVHQQAVTYYPIADVSGLKEDETTHMAFGGEYESEHWLAFKDKEGNKRIKVDRLPMKGLKFPFNWESVQKLEVKRAKSDGRYEAQDDLVLCKK